MTDKQIIIDGVDVSGCIECDTDKIKYGYDALCCLTNCSCKHHPNCYYKQLQRKEQECERLEEELNDLTRDIKTTLEVEKIKLDKLKQAEQKLEKIKKVCNKFTPDHYKILLIINGGIVEE